MSELEILRSEIEALRLENQALKTEIQALKTEIQVLKTENKELLYENYELTDTIKREVTNRCYNCNDYGAERRYVNKIGTRMVCEDCYDRANQTHKW